MGRITGGLYSPEQVMERSGARGLLKSLQIMSNEHVNAVIYADGDKLTWGSVEADCRNYHKNNQPATAFAAYWCKTHGWNPDMIEDFAAALELYRKQF